MNTKYSQRLKIKRLHLCDNQTRNVWNQTCSHPCLWTTSEKHEDSWILLSNWQWCNISPQNTKNKVQSLFIWFWGKLSLSRNADQIHNKLGEKYAITTQWEGNVFCDLTLDLNYEAVMLIRKLQGMFPMH